MDRATFDDTYTVDITDGALIALAVSTVLSIAGWSLGLVHGAIPAALCLVTAFVVVCIVVAGELLS